MSLLTMFNLLPECPEALQKAVSQVVRKAAFDIQAAAAANAPVDTGFLRSSIYVVTHSESTYGQGSDNPPSGATLLDPVDAPPDDRTAYVAVGANYGIYVEMGTANMAAQPYLLPAAEAVKPAYLAAMARLEGPILSFLGGGGSISTGPMDSGGGE